MIDRSCGNKIKRNSSRYYAFYALYRSHKLFLYEIPERHLGEGTASAVSLQLYLDDSVGYVDQLNISTIYAKALPYPIEGGLYVIF